MDDFFDMGFLEGPVTEEGDSSFSDEWRYVLVDAPNRRDVGDGVKLPIWLCRPRLVHPRFCMVQLVPRFEW